MTADTYSNTLGVLLMGTGNDNNTWGGNANTAVFQILEDAIANVLTSSVTGGTLDLSGTPPPAAASQARYAALIFSGVLGSAQSIQVPNLTKFWFVQNTTSGSFALTFKTPTGSASAAIPQNSGWQLVQCDGANGIVVSPFNSKQILMPDGGATSPEHSNINEPTSGWRRAGTQDWRLMINGLDVLQVTGAGASSPSVVNVLSPNVLQVNGAQVIPAGSEQAGAFIELPAGGWLWEDGTAYNRVGTYATLFGAITKTAVGATHASTALDLDADYRGKGLEGAYVEGTGITLGTTVVSFSAAACVLSQAAAGTASGLAIRFLPNGQGDGSTTFNVPDRRYRALIGRDNMNNNPAARSSLYAGTHLNTTGGAETVTVLQANLASFSLTVSIPSGQGSHSHSYIKQASNNGAEGTSGAGINSAGDNTGAATLPALTGTAASGGSSAGMTNMPQFGITNYAIKT